MTNSIDRPLAISVGSDLTTYVDDVRRALRLTSPEDFGSWRSAYDRGITSAYQRNDIDGLLSIATFGAACLDAQGFHEATIEQLTFAIDMAAHDPNARAYLLSLRGGFEAIMGRHADAAASIDAALASREVVTDERARISVVTYQAVVRCVRLELSDRSALTAAIPEAERHGFDWFSSALKCWLVCYLFATGEPRTGGVWIESLRLQAEATNHPARRVDASVLQSAARQLALGSIADDEADTERTLNHNALWRLSALKLHRALLRGAWEDAEMALARLDETAKVVSPGFTDGAGAFRALLAAYRGDTAGGEIRPPSQLGLTNVSAALAGLETVAIAGSQAEAAEWLASATERVPAHVRTSLEWPACLDRVVGLLRVRAGDLRGGVTALRRAIRWCDTAGYEVEARIARVQLAEVLEHSATAGRRRDILDLRTTSWVGLAAMGIDATRQAYVATRAIALSQDIEQPRLTRREVEVLRLLGEGMTYKAAASPLGISWRTVQLHAHRAYSKLGASGRMQALALAREQHIL